MSLTTRVLIALVAGIGVGLLLSTTDPALARGVVAVVEPVGTLFVNAIRMTVIPLVVARISDEGRTSVVDRKSVV